MSSAPIVTAARFIAFTQHLLSFLKGQDSMSMITIQKYRGVIPRISRKGEQLMILIPYTNEGALNEESFCIREHIRHLFRILWMER